jgi:polyhydroxyalkanoate synthesis regulator phasin
MDEPGSRSSPNGRGLLEEILLAGLGAVSLTAERADRLADELAERGGLERSEARRTVEQLLGRWRGDSVRLGERASEGLAGLFRELGLVTRDEWEELELRVAQLEHRLRLVEGEPQPRRRTAL